MDIFRLALQPASDGDALILTWGSNTAPQHALIDLGRTKDYKALKPLLQDIAQFELFAMTHIDADHIEGVVPMFKETPLPFSAGNVWFNAYAQLEAANERLPDDLRVTLGAAQAEKVTEGIIKSKWPWNGPFKSRIVSVDSPEAKNGAIALAGGLSLTLLSPTDKKLATLKPKWEEELKDAKLRTTDSVLVAEALARDRVHLGPINVEALAGKAFVEDASEPNGASIAFVAEFSGKCVLLTGDSHPGVIEASLRKRGFSENKRLKLNCVKVAHHGSKANTSPSLLKIIDCTTFAFSTNGSRHDHPDAETIARILVADPKRTKTLIFNFRQDHTTMWDNTTLMKKWKYACVFPPEGSEGIEFDI